MDLKPKVPDNAIYIAPVSWLVGCFGLKGSSQHKVGGEWFEIKLGKISRMLVKYEVLPIPNVIFVC